MMNVAWASGAVTNKSVVVRCGGVNRARYCVIVGGFISTILALVVIV